jgi:hypothetical protein
LGQYGASLGQNPRRPGRPRIDGDIESKIRELALLGWTAPQIDRWGKAREEFKGRWPLAVRTVRRVVDRHVPRGAPPDWWSLADADPDEAALVLPTLREIVEGGYVPIYRLARGLADWIVRVRRAAPSIPPSWALDVALNYLGCAQEGEPTHGLDLLLAFAPWESREHYYRYIREVARLCPHCFNAYQEQESGPPLVDFNLAAMERDPIAFGLAIAVVKYAQGKGPPPARRQKGESDAKR